MSCQPLYRTLVYKWSLFNQVCLLCDERARNPYALCEPCELEMPWLRERCGYCSLPMPMDGLVCGQCSRHRPAFTQVETPWRYEFPLDSLITRFKHQGRWPLGRMLAQVYGNWLAHRYGDGLERPDCLVPVPMAQRHLRQRGFNQAALLARWLGRQLQLPCAEQIIQRPQENLAQQGLSARDRQRNLRQAFSLVPGARATGLHVAVVDDVMTTGATVNGLAHLLKQAGARQVDVYCLARTPRPGHA